MKKNITRRLTTALLAAAMCVSMAACGSKTDDTKTDGTGDADGAKKYTIGVCQVVEEYLTGKGITCTRYSFSDSNDVAAVTTKPAADSDVIYIPTDNTAASCTETIGSIVLNAKTPVVAGEKGICTGAAVCTMLLLGGQSPWLALLCAVLAGVLAGAVTGLLHVGLGIPPILAGILTQMVLWSVNLKLLGKANQALPARTTHVLLSQMDVGGALPVLLGFCVVLVALLVLFFDTELGCALRATGCNPVMSRAQGVNTGLMKIIGLALSNGVVALSGALLCQYQGYTDVNMGRGAVVIGLAAVVIGQAVLGRRGGRMAVQLGGVILGAVIYYIVYQVIIFAGFDTDLLKMFSAVVVAVFLGAPHVKAQLKAHSRSKKGDSGHAENE